MSSAEIFEEVIAATMRRTGVSFAEAIRSARAEHPRLWSSFVESLNAAERVRALAAIGEQTDV